MKYLFENDIQTRQFLALTYAGFSTKKYRSMNENLIANTLGKMDYIHRSL